MGNHTRAKRIGLWQLNEEGLLRRNRCLDIPQLAVLAWARVFGVEEGAMQTIANRDGEWEWVIGRYNEPVETVKSGETLALPASGLADHRARP